MNFSGVFKSKFIDYTIDNYIEDGQLLYISK